MVKGDNNFERIGCTQRHYFIYVFIWGNLIMCAMSFLSSQELAYYAMFVQSLFVVVGITLLVKAEGKLKVFYDPKDQIIFYFGKEFKVSNLYCKDRSLFDENHMKIIGSSNMGKRLLSRLCEIVEKR